MTEAPTAGRRAFKAVLALLIALGALAAAQPALAGGNGGGNDKISLCNLTNGNPNSFRIIEVGSESAALAHEAKGDIRVATGTTDVSVCLQFLPKIQITKVCENGAQGQFTINVGGGVGNVVIGCGQTEVRTLGLTGGFPRLVTVTEPNAPANINVTIQCRLSANGQLQTLPTTGINLTLGATLFCVVTNRRVAQVPPAQGELKVCKLGQAGQTFTFRAFRGTEQVGQAQITSPSCAALGFFNVDTELRVQEVAATGTQVTAIDVDPANRIVGTRNLAQGNVTVKIGTGITLVTFTNGVLAPIQNGILNICKIVNTTATANTTFNFTVGTQPVAVTINAGAQTNCVQVPRAAGAVTVTEQARTGFELVDITGGTNVNLTARSATATVVAGQATTITFVNRVVTGPSPGGGTGGTTPTFLCPQVTQGPLAFGQLQLTFPGTLGVTAIRVDIATNLNVTIGGTAVAVGGTAQVGAAGTVVLATRVNLLALGQLQVTVTAGGQTFVCDPVMQTFLLGRTGKPVTKTYTGIPQAESKITLKNEKPGAKKAVVYVNGKVFAVVQLRSGQTVTLNAAAVMKPGNENTIAIKAYPATVKAAKRTVKVGKRTVKVATLLRPLRGSITILISD